MTRLAPLILTIVGLVAGLAGAFAPNRLIVLRRE
jgi:hypothetical protein